jgi:uncharacterized membrane protein YsdA (DUF1294 family)/cold shock CspA family protein
MRFRGTLINWNDERGFGYIESSEGGEPIFAHVSAWPRGTQRPRLNQAVSFEVELGPKGKRASNVQPILPGRSVSRRVGGGQAKWGTASLFCIPAFLLIYGLVAVLWRPPLWVAGLYGGVSLVTFLAYARDKSAALHAERRMPESSLHFLAIVCGWPGALLAQQFLRHKSTKREFRQVFWVTVLLNISAFLVLASPARGLLLKLL